MRASKIEVNISHAWFLNYRSIDAPRSMSAVPSTGVTSRWAFLHHFQHNALRPSAPSYMCWTPQSGECGAQYLARGRGCARVQCEYIVGGRCEDQGGVTERTAARLEISRRTDKTVLSSGAVATCERHRHVNPRMIPSTTAYVPAVLTAEGQAPQSRVPPQPSLTLPQP